MKKLLKVCFNSSEWSPTRADWLRLVASLPKPERDRLAAFAFKRDSKNSLVGQILVRLCLRRLLPRVDWHNLVIERNAKGRPCLRLKETLQLANITDFGPNQIDFNVTHSGDLCAVVAGIRPTLNANSTKSQPPPPPSPDPWLGVDCMRIEVDHASKLPESVDPYEKEFTKHERVIRSKFTSSEKEFVNSRASWAEKLAAFYRVWCLKESYAKAIGTGMSGIDPTRVEFQIGRELMIDPSGGKHKQFVVTDTRVLVSGKPKRECTFGEQYWIRRGTSAVGRLDLHVIAVCVINAVEGGGGGGGGMGVRVDGEDDEFAEMSFSELMDEFAKANPNAEPIGTMAAGQPNPTPSASKLAKELDDLWTHFSKKL